ncbi:hypothetical protein [Caballeronia sp.]|jgi:hypothetical protein|uniref:hypothetical protein n=1 Tax=Caballeronia sp. TaxID=1931223 RepID=UPI00261B6183|nr:hypothetical protein [Caballeronia sp.]
MIALHHWRDNKACALVAPQVCITIVQHARNATTGQQNCNGNGARTQHKHRQQNHGICAKSAPS